MKLEFDDSSNRPLVHAPPSATAPPAPAAPPLAFDLPDRLLRQLALVTVGYVAVMGFAFRAGTGIGLIFAIFGIVLVGYYGLPVVMARASGARREAGRKGAWGIDTASGYLPGHAAWAQIMTVPLLMLGWAVFVAVIH